MQSDGRHPMWQNRRRAGVIAQSQWSRRASDGRPVSGRSVRLVAELDASGEWAVDGAPSCAHWVAIAIDVEVCTAREMGTNRTSTDGAAEIADGVRSGTALVQQGALIDARSRRPTTRSSCARWPSGYPRAGSTHALASWLARHESPAETEVRHQDARHFSWRLDLDGMIVGSFRLSPARGGSDHGARRCTRVADRGRTYARPTRPRTRRTKAGARSVAVASRQQRADALVDLVSGGGAAITTEIVLHVRRRRVHAGRRNAGRGQRHRAHRAVARSCAALIHDAERGRSTPRVASGIRPLVNAGSSSERDRVVHRLRRDGVPAVRPRTRLRGQPPHGGGRAPSRGARPVTTLGTVAKGTCAGD